MLYFIFSADKSQSSESSESIKGVNMDGQAALDEINEKYKQHLDSNDQKTINKASKVEIVDIDMPFLSMVFFMVKWAIASIPALIILYIVFVAFGGTLVAILK